jgi:predicted transcriptional regulator
MKIFAFGNSTGVYVQDICRKAGRSDLFDFCKDIDWDQMFEGIARKCIAKSPIHVDQHDYHDLIMNALMDSVTISSIKSYPYQNHPKNWDTEAKHFVIYVANMFNLRMMTTMTSNFNQKKRLTQKPGGDNRSDEEWMDSRDTRNKEQEDKTTYKQLLIQLSKYLASKAEGRYYLGMLPMFLQGYSSIEVATKLGVSEGLVSKYLQRMKEEILTFAKNSKNDELYDLMSGYMRQRRHTLKTATDDDAAGLRQVFEMYRRKMGSVKVAEDDQYYYENRPSRHQEPAPAAPKPKLTLKKYDKSCYQVFKDGRIIGMINAFANGGWAGFDLSDKKMAGTFGKTPQEVLEKWPVDSIKTEGDDEDAGEPELDYDLLIARLKQDIILAERRIARNPDPALGRQQMQLIEHYKAQIEDLERQKREADFAEGSAKRQPTGEVTEIRRSIRDDIFAEKTMAELLLSDKVSQAAIDTSAEDFMAFCGSSGDLIEADGKIIGLSVNSNEVRDQGPQRFSRVEKKGEDDKGSGVLHPTPDSEFAGEE